MRPFKVSQKERRTGYCLTRPHLCIRSVALQNSLNASCTSDLRGTRGCQLLSPMLLWIVPVPPLGMFFTSWGGPLLCNATRNVRLRRPKICIIIHLDACRWESCRRVLRRRFAADNLSGYRLIFRFLSLSAAFNRSTLFLQCTVESSNLWRECRVSQTSRTTQVYFQMLKDIVDLR